MFQIIRRALLFSILVSFAGVLGDRIEYTNGKLENVVQLYSPMEYELKYCKKPDVNGDGIFFNFYTRERFLLNLNLENITERIFPAYYNVNKITKILVHGYNGSSNMETFQKMVDDYLYTQDVNVITMDWSVYAKRCKLESVFTDVTTVSAEVLGTVMRSLLSRGTDATKFHVIGFNAGAHIAGVAGKIMHPHMIGRITALDPMGVNYDYSGYPKLHTGDAYLVDVIYATDGDQTSKRDFGHIVFYPEVVRYPQPGNENKSEYSSVLQSVYYFRRSIVTPYAYPAKKFYSRGLRTGSKGEGSTYTADNYMGEYVDWSKRGRFYVEVKVTDSDQSYRSTSSML